MIDKSQEGFGSAQLRMRKGWAAAVAISLVASMFPLLSFADEAPVEPTPSVTATTEPSEPTPPTDGGQTPSEAPVSPTPSETAPAPETPTPEVPMVVEPAPEDVQPDVAEPGAMQRPANPEPEQRTNTMTVAAEPAVAGTLTVASSPSGFQVGANYVFSGTALPDAPVHIFWDLQGSNNWRTFAQTTADASGRYQAVAPIGSAAQFKFAATGGHVPGATAPAGGWEAAVVAVDVVPAGSSSGALSVTSSPAGFLVGGNYVFSGVTTPGLPVTIWWDLQGSNNWRVFANTTAGSDGTFRLVVPIGSAARFKFAASSGHVPSSSARAGEWATSAVLVNVFPAASAPTTLNVSSTPAGFHAGSSYVFSGKTSPAMPVVIFWDLLDSNDWRVFTRTVAGADGTYRVTVPINSAARFKFAATSGHSPSLADPPGAWSTTTSYVNAVLAGAVPSLLNVTSEPAGFYIGANYLFQGKTTPRMPVTVWWDLQGSNNWRVFGRTTAGADGSYRLVLPIGSAASFRFAATSGQLPDASAPGGWATGIAYVKSTVSPAMTLDPRCLTGRVICISKGQRMLSWVVDGKIQFVMDVRFGSSKLPTRNGAFRVTWKSRDHVSSIYGSAMPFSLFFDGGRAVHYSRSFYEYGWTGTSAGCVNTRDYKQSEILFNLAKVGDKVIVF